MAEPQQSSDDPSSPVVAIIPVNRWAALTRGILWAVSALMAASVLTPIYSRINLHASAMSNRIVDYGLLVVALPIGILAFVCIGKCVSWMLLVAWPLETSIAADEESLVLRLGPFGTRRYEARQLETRYPFEFSDDGAEGGFESFLPEEQQRDTLLPRITHAGVSEPLNRTLIRFAGRPEKELARQLRPVLDLWRARTSANADGASR